MVRFRFLLFLLLAIGCLFCTQGLRAQSLSAQGLPFELQGGIGAIWAHNEKADNLVQSHPISGYVQAWPHAWQRLAGKRESVRFGVSLGYIASGQPQILGSYIPIELHSRRHYGQKTGKGFYTDLGAGFAYGNRPFRAETNPTNGALGSHVSAALRYSLCYAIPLGTNSVAHSRANPGAKAGSLTLGLFMAHCSAAALRLPNAGINMFGASIGYQIGQPESDPKQQAMADSSRPKRWQIWTLAAGGAKSIDYHPAPLYGCAQASLGIAYSLHRNAITLSADYLYNASLRPEGRRLGYPVAYPARLGLAIGHRWVIAKPLYFSIALGAYIHNPLPILNKPIYQQYTVQFRAHKALSPSIMLRAHYGQADCALIGLVWRWW